jgi:hypothetical protein
VVTHCGVSPFGNLGIKACVPLPRAYRSLPRPSSPPCAQASSICLRSLDSKACQAKHALNHERHITLFARNTAGDDSSDHASLEQRGSTQCYSLPSVVKQRAQNSAVPRGARGHLLGNDDRIESEERDGRLQSGFRRLTMSGPTRHGSGKEVIQPQVPLRLPCYDFAPVTALAFGGLLLTVATPTSGTHSFHGVTGGVYKARERIHRDVADSRLLAIPASCRRVADDNPN